jgi:hypothetical protein
MLPPMREIFVVLIAQILFVFPGFAAIVERPISDVIYGSAPGFRDYPQIASDGQNFLVVWHDARALPPAIYAAHVNRDGELLDPTGIRIPVFTNHPAVVFAGDSYLILWSDRNLYAARVSGEGQLVETQRLLASDVPAGNFTAASNGSNIVVAWRDRFSVFTAGGELLQSNVRIPVIGAINVSTRLASNGSGFLLAWSNAFAPMLQAWLLDSNGQPLRSVDSISISTAPDVGVGSDGRDYIVLYSNNITSRVESRSVSGDGTHVGPAVGLPAVRFGTSDVPLAWDGNSYLAFVRGSVSAQSDWPQELRRTRIDAEGRPLNEPTQTVASAFEIGNMDVASNGHDVLVAWRGRRVLEDLNNVYAAKVSGTVDQAAAGTLLSRSATPQIAPSIAFSGRNYLVTRREQSALYFNRILPNGDHLDDSGTFVSPVSNGTAAPRVVFDSENYILAWIAEGTINGVRSALLRVARVQPDSGAVLDTLGIVVDESGGVSSFDIASDGNVIALVWSGNGRIHAARFNRHLQILDLRHDLSPNDMSAANPAVVWNGTDWLVAFDEQFFYYGGISPPLLIRANIHAIRLSPLFNLLDPDPIPVAVDAAESNSRARIASDGNESAILWTGGPFGQTLVRARHIKNGVFLDDMTTLANGNASSIVWDGSRYAIAYESKRADRTSDAFLLHLGRAGETTAQDQQIISATADDETSPFLVAIGGGRVTASYLRIATEPLYGGVSRAFVRDPIPLRTRPVRSRSDPSIVRPSCADPAPLSNPNSRLFPGRLVDDYIVLLKFGFNVNVEGPRLAGKYNFSIQELFTIIPAFVANLDGSTVARLRCEPSVQNLEFAHTNIPPP